MSEWGGITHFCPYWALGLWRRFLCRRDMHCFDEVMSSGGPRNHFLSCDACNLMVWIDDIETTYVEGSNDRG